MPEVANALGLYSKIDVSHGFPQFTPFETFRDFQDDSINSEGYFAWFVVYVCLLASIYTFYCYMLPFYWIRKPLRRQEELRLRMRDYLSSTASEEVWGNQYLEVAYSPHHFKNMREGLLKRYANPDDIRSVFMSTYNRKHKYKEHYMKKVGENMADMTTL